MLGSAAVASNAAQYLCPMVTWGKLWSAHSAIHVSWICCCGVVSEMVSISLRVRAFCSSSANAAQSSSGYCL